MSFRINAAEVLVCLAIVPVSLVYVMEQEPGRAPSVKRLPSEKFKFKLRVFNNVGIVNKFDFSYVVFSHWEREGGSIKVTHIAYFKGGNSGGCNERYSKVGDIWVRQSSDCFAAASQPLLPSHIGTVWIESKDDKFVTWLEDQHRSEKTWEEFWKERGRFLHR